MTSIPAPADRQPSETSTERKAKADAHNTSPWAILKQTVSDWSEDKAMKLSAALALYAIISLAPLLVISIKVLSMIFGDEAAAGQVGRQMSMLVGQAGAQAINDMIKHASQPGQGILATIISLVVLIFSASGVFGELQDSLNTIWGVKPRPNLGWWITIKNRLLSMGMVFVIAFLLLISMAVSTVLTTVTGWLLGPDAGWIGIGTDIIVSVVVVTLLVAAIFRVLPDARIGWRDVILGALITAVLFKIGQYGLGLYFRFGSSTSAYGAAGSFVAVLLWVYYSAWILFFGAEFTKVWAVRHGRRIVPTSDAIKLTDEDRAQQGIASDEHLERRTVATRQQQTPPGKDVPGPEKRPSRGAEWEIKEREWD
jgi:membrane protein